MKKIDFVKVQAAGNDFVMVDSRQFSADLDVAALARRICHRQFGVGADGVIFIDHPAGYDFEMRYINADGSGPAMCGNGARSALLFVHRHIRTQEQYRFVSVDGPHEGTVQAGEVRVTIREPEQIQAIRLGSETAYLVDTGVPHMVRLSENLDSFDIDAESPALRKQYDANINYIQQRADGSWSIRTWERGVEGETLACGTGATASALVIQRYLEDQFPISLRARGGVLTIDKKSGKLWLGGPTHEVFYGTIPFESKT
jgi:diaminopimelate epimerase